jgi:regulator of sirC expression with transglutaminase-like and TPR domain
VNQVIDEIQVKALINLLEDTDEEIIHVVSEKLIECNISIIPQLEKVWENSLNPVLQERIENIIQEIQLRNVYIELRKWNLIGGKDILKGAYIIAKYQYPEINFNSIVDQIQKIKNDVWLEINSNLTALEKVRVINHIFYEIHKFSGNFSNYYSPYNYYINQVLETRKGNPVTLGIIYITIAQWLELPIYGVNIPKNFLLAYKDTYATNDENDILFYINPYNKGTVLGRKEIEFFLKQQKIKSDESFYKPCSNRIIIERLLLNIINSYESTGQIEKTSKFQKLLSALK